jgi:hypothetical protein
VDTLIKIFLRHARERPSMFGLDGSFGEYVAFLSGLDTGAGGRVLEGFGAWVARRAGHEGRDWDLVWPRLVLRAAGVEPPAEAWHGLGGEDDARAAAALFELLGEFARDRT